MPCAPMVIVRHLRLLVFSLHLTRGARDEDGRPQGGRPKGGSQGLMERARTLSIVRPSGLETQRRDQAKLDLSKGLLAQRQEQATRDRSIDLHHDAQLASALRAQQAFIALRRASLAAATSLAERARRWEVTLPSPVSGELAGTAAAAGNASAASLQEVQVASPRGGAGEGAYDEHPKDGVSGNGWKAAHNGAASPAVEQRQAEGELETINFFANSAQLEDVLHGHEVKLQQLRDELTEVNAIFYHEFALREKDRLLHIGVVYEPRIFNHAPLRLSLAIGHLAESLESLGLPPLPSPLATRVLQREEAERAPCLRDTGHSCRLWSCHASRGATCVHHRCVCSRPGACVHAGQCF